MPGTHAFDRLRQPSAGQPLPADIRALTESLAAVDLSGVRIHVDAAAQRIGALAFTCGDRIHFAPGQYDPTSERGVWLLAHELAHVIQQRKGQARNQLGYGVVVLRDAALESEADRFAARLVELWRSGAASHARRAPHDEHPGRVSQGRVEMADRKQPA